MSNNYCGRRATPRLPLSSACSNSPPNAVVLNNLGAALMALGQHDEGSYMLEQALLLDPLSPDVLVNLGVHLQEEGDLDHAKSLYTR